MEQPNYLRQDLALLGLLIVLLFGSMAALRYWDSQANVLDTWSKQLMLSV